jgi:hypothetical protein
MPLDSQALHISSRLCACSRLSMSRVGGLPFGTGGT